MCLYKKVLVREHELQKALKKSTKVAKRDILVYKKFLEIGDRLHGYYQNGYQWPLSGIAKVKQFGAYLEDERLSWKTLRIDEGLHAMTVNITNTVGNVVIRRMIIPKGTLYICGEDNEIVALKMRLAKVKDKDVKPL